MIINSLQGSIPDSKGLDRNLNPGMLPFRWLKVSSFLRLMPICIKPTRHEESAGGHPGGSFFFKNLKLLGLGRQIVLKFFEAFGLFSAKLSALFWHCESIPLSMGKCICFIFLQKTLVFRSKTPKYDIGCKEFRSLHTSVFGQLDHSSAV